MSGSPRSYLLRLLKRRLHSRHELEQALRKRHVEPEQIAELLKELEAAGLIDDTRFARAWVNDRDRFRPRGKYILQAELAKKGIDRELIKQTLTDREEREEEPVNEFEQAKALAEQVGHRYAHLDAQTRYRRLGSFLLRRGFTPDVVRRILEA